jgi:hypothetical protein
MGWLRVYARISLRPNLEKLEGAFKETSQYERRATHDAEDYAQSIGDLKKG